MSLIDSLMNRDGDNAGSQALKNNATTQAQLLETVQLMKELYQLQSERIVNLEKFVTELSKTLLEVIERSETK